GQWHQITMHSRIVGTCDTLRSRKHRAKTTAGTHPHHPTASRLAEVTLVADSSNLGWWDVVNAGTLSERSAKYTHEKYHYITTIGEMIMNRLVIMTVGKTHSGKTTF